MWREALFFGTKGTGPCPASSALPKGRRVSVMISEVHSLLFWGKMKILCFVCFDRHFCKEVSTKENTNGCGTFLLNSAMSLK